MTTNASPYRRLLHGLFTTALEGGIGYWSSCRAYRWSTDMTYEHDDLEGFFAEITDEEEDEDYRIDRTVVARGYRLATSKEWRNKISWSTDAPPLVVTEESLDEWDYDAGDADVIVQLGLFGNVVYG